MKLFRGALLAVLIGAVCPVQAKETFLCTHQSGDISFTSNTVLIERDGTTVSVFDVRSGKPARDDRWVYQVHAEHKEIGMQAVRANPESGGKGSSVAVDYGGLLFVTRERGKITAYVVSAQASTRETLINTLFRQSRRRETSRGSAKVSWL